MYTPANNNSNTKNHISFTNNPSQIDFTDTHRYHCDVCVRVRWLGRISATRQPARKLWPVKIQVKNNENVHMYVRRSGTKKNGKEKYTMTLHSELNEKRECEDFQDSSHAHTHMHISICAICFRFQLVIWMRGRKTHMHRRAAWKLGKFPWQLKQRFSFYSIGSSLI